MKKYLKNQVTWKAIFLVCLRRVKQTAGSWVGPARLMLFLDSIILAFDVTESWGLPFERTIATQVPKSSVAEIVTSSNVYSGVTLYKLRT